MIIDCLIIMSEEESEGLHHTQNIEQIKPKEEAERKFGCPCGKWYLSYPALFTHVKQKHDGKAPGNLIKPKTDKARGRPRLSPNPNEQDQSVANYDCVEELEKAVANHSIAYEGEYVASEGSETCQDMGSHFMKMLVGRDEEKRLLACFLNYIRFEVTKKYEEGYWQTQKPGDIIDISNDIVRELEDNTKEFPLDKEVLIDLLYVLFRWMYKNKWTDHKLVRRNSEQDNKTTA